MLISIWWVVAAFICGGSAGVVALAMFSGGRFDDERELADHPLISPTQ